MKSAYKKPAIAGINRLSVAVTAAIQPKTMRQQRQSTHQVIAKLNGAARRADEALAL